MSLCSWSYGLQCQTFLSMGPNRLERYLARLDRFDECQAAVAAACARLTRDEALERLTRAGAPVAPVLDPAEMAANEQFRVREVVFDAGDGTARLGFPARLQDHPPRPPGPIPEIDRDRSGWTPA